MVTVRSDGLIGNWQSQPDPVQARSHKGRGGAQRGFQGDTLSGTAVPDDVPDPVQATQRDPEGPGDVGRHGPRIVDQVRHPLRGGPVGRCTSWMRP
ncbi:hypothetical protein NFX46_21750 [Streptomyces phaeoluteigriseus]|uniref:Uncharacterized protein n=1 Tax=Streptomyces phaeoluteigriseus TaxID=114686 RepID=A0ABY4ZB38_9ACTN|nr:hypothetical protein [Streptomyces phaeoluteigriseus]USQ86102.1 hypothetical protein NFX46_21750 [Streptomyces phaeoluteigriseus]